MIDSSARPGLGTLALPSLQGGGDRVVWPAMFDLADRLPPPWVMIGGQMVILHGLLAGRSTPRVTKDIDLLFDIRFTVDAVSSCSPGSRGFGLRRGRHQRRR
ncbi:hypothetical protein [Amycolatopsis regifaucium]|uniref:hypothetical protein n=1 Tax=Amycolatopsis regifaucium TaxID=546365 RepID=UPI000B1308B5|nr:hypothetical protein [Amycolatopsis regifaucium]